MSSMAGTMSLQRVYIYVISALSEIHLIQRTSLPMFHTKLYIQKLESFFSNFERALLFSTESSLQGCFCWQLGKLYVLLSPARESKLDKLVVLWSSETTVLETILNTH